MSLVPITPGTTRVAYTATAGSLTGLDNTKQMGLARYVLTTTSDAYYAQGISDTVFTADATTDTLTAVAHGLFNAMPVQVSNSGGGLPAGLAATTTYWAIVVSLDTFKLATTRANAIAGTAIDITTNGTGTQTATTVATVAAGSNYIPAKIPTPIDGFFGSKISIVRDTADGAAILAPALQS